MLDAPGPPRPPACSRQDGDRLRWRHALTRDAVVAGLLPPERAALARRAAAALADRGGPDDDALAAELLAAAGEQAGPRRLFRLARRTCPGPRCAARRAAARAGRAHRRRPGRRRGRAGPVRRHPGRRRPGRRGGGAAAAATGERTRSCACSWPAPRWPPAGGRTPRPGSSGPAGRTTRARWCWPPTPRSAPGDVERAGPLAAAAVTGRSAPARRRCCARRSTSSAGRPVFADPPAAGAAFRRAAQVAAEHGLAAAAGHALIGWARWSCGAARRAEALRPGPGAGPGGGMLGQASAAEVILFDPDRRASTARGPWRRPRGCSSTGRPAAHAGGAGGQCLRASPSPGPRRGTRPARRRRWPGCPVSAAWPDAAPLAAAVRALPAAAGARPRRRRTRRSTRVWPGCWRTASAPRCTSSGCGRCCARRSTTGTRRPGTCCAALPAALRPANRGALRYADAIAAGRAGRPRRGRGLFAAGDADLAGSPWLHRLLRLPVLEAAVADGWGDPVPLLRRDLAEHERAGDHQLARTCRDLLRRAGAPTRRGRGTSPVPGALRAPASPAGRWTSSPWCRRADQRGDRRAALPLRRGRSRPTWPACWPSSAPPTAAELRSRVAALTR